jgi:signal transduction histidine kinase
MSDGLPTIECSGGFQPAGCRTPDGRLWFPTIKGLVSISPGEVMTNLLAPPVLIEKLLIDDLVTSNPIPDGSSLQVPPGRHRIEFQYTGLSFVAPERVRFKCRLNGLDKEWLDLGNKRVVNYSYIPPGRYGFQVTACNNDGIWNETGAQLGFEVMPFFWQTLWFRMLGGGTAVVASGGIVWLDSRRRMRRRLERLERQRAVENERTRIAHDIHDDLGAHLTRISILSDPGRNEQSGVQAASANLSRIHGTARELTRAMDEIVWAANPQHDTFESLVNYLHKFAQDFLESADIRCRVDVPFDLPCWPLSPEIRHNLFLAFKEALNNAVRHAGASEIRIHLKLEPDGFALMIEDNGKGFALGTVETGNGLAHFEGNGLKTMQSRLAGINGRCEFHSVAGRGTVVTFRLPVKAS